MVDSVLRSKLRTKTKKAVGLDIGQSFIKLVELELKGETVRLCKLEAVSSAQPAKLSGATEQVQEIKQAIAGLMARHQLKQEEIILSVSGHSVFIKFLDVLPVKTEKLEQTIRYEAQQQIPFSLDEVEWDADVLASARRQTAAAYRVLLVAVKKDKLASRMELIKEMNLHPEVLDVGILGLYNCIRFNRDYDAAKLTCVIDIGEESSDLLLLEGDNFWMRSFAIGREGRESQEMFKPWLEDLQGEIGRSVEYYSFQKKQMSAPDGEGAQEQPTGPTVEATADGQLEEILLSGSAALVPGLDRFLAEKFACVVRPVVPFKRLEVDAEIEGRLDLVPQCLFTQAVGLALRGIGKAEVKINLLKEQARQSHFARQKMFFGVGSVILAFLILVGASTFIRRDYREKGQRLKQLKELAKTFATYQPQLTELQEKQKLLAQKTRVFKTLALNRALWLEALSEVQKMLPDGLWLTDFAGTISTEALPEADFTSKLDLQGRAVSYDDVNEFVAQLKTSALFTEVKPLSSAYVEEGPAAQADQDAEKEKTEVVKFAISMQVLPLK